MGTLVGRHHPKEIACSLKFALCSVRNEVARCHRLGFKLSEESIILSDDVQIKIEFKSDTQ